MAQHILPLKPQILFNKRLKISMTFLFTKRKFQGIEFLVFTDPVTSIYYLQILRTFWLPKNIKTSRLNVVSMESLIYFLLDQLCSFETYLKNSKTNPAMQNFQKQYNVHARNCNVIVLLYCKFPYIYDHYLCTGNDLRYSAIFSLNQNHRLLKI